MPLARTTATASTAGRAPQERVHGRTGADRRHWRRRLHRWAPRQPPDPRGTPRPRGGLPPLDRWHQLAVEAENLVLDLRLATPATRRSADATAVYNLAADMGGMGFIENNKALCMLSVLINTHLLQAARRHDVDRFFFSSSACVYAGPAAHTGHRAAARGRRLPGRARRRLRMGEALLGAHVPSFHRGLRAVHAGRPVPQRLRAPWHLERRSREGSRCDLPQDRRGEDLRRPRIEIWGDGEQTRSFTYIDDCVAGHADDHGLGHRSPSTSGRARW